MSTINLPVQTTTTGQYNLSPAQLTTTGTNTNVPWYIQSMPAVNQSMDAMVIPWERLQELLRQLTEFERCVKYMPAPTTHMSCNKGDLRLTSTIDEHMKTIYSALKEITRVLGEPMELKIIVEKNKDKIELLYKEWTEAPFGLTFLDYLRRMNL